MFLHYTCFSGCMFVSVVKGTWIYTFVKHLLVCALSNLYLNYVFRYVISTSWCVNKDGWSAVGRVKFATMAATESCNQWEKMITSIWRAAHYTSKHLQNNNLFLKPKAWFIVKEKIPVFFHLAANTQANKNTSRKLLHSFQQHFYECYKVGILYMS